MGAVPSTPSRQDTAEYLITTFVGDKSFPISSDYWNKLLELPFTLQWPSYRVHQACQAFVKNNCDTRHLAKILVHLAWSLQECMSGTATAGSSTAYTKAINAAYIASLFLKYTIENAKTENFEELYLSQKEEEAALKTIPKDENIGSFVMHAVVIFIGTSDVSSQTYLLHHELLNFVLVAMSTQLRSGPIPGPKDVHPFIDAAMDQESSVVGLVVRRLLLNYILRPRIPPGGATHSIFFEGGEPGVLHKVGSAAANLVLMPVNFLVSSSDDVSRNPLADKSLLLLLIFINYQKCVKENSCFSENHYYKALENARDVEFDRVDIEGNIHGGPFVRLSFASLFDTLGLHLADEGSVLLLYTLIHGNSDFLEYVLVRTDLDTLLIPILETLYNASRSTSDQIYMLLIILLILSQDSSFNASIHKLILPSVPWYKDRLLHNTSLGSLMIIILVRTVKYNLSQLQDVYLHTNCLATLANMAPHVNRLSAYASQRLINLFDMLSHKYTKLAEQKNDKTRLSKVNSTEGSTLLEDMSAELHIYTDFLRIVLESLNAILTYAIPRNPEVVYAIMHRQEVFQPFKNHPRFNELLENIYLVLDFFNSRMDAQRTDGEWSVAKVLQVITINCRSWRGEGMKMFTQLKFTYAQENHPEEFFVPYVWKLVLSHGRLGFNLGAINLFTVHLTVESADAAEESSKEQTHESYV